MPGILQLALTGVEYLSTFNLSFTFFILILPAQVLVYIETEICSFGNIPIISCFTSMSLNSFHLFAF